MTGRVVLVQGVLGAVGSLAAQLATWGGATVIGTVRHTADLARLDRSVVPHAVALDQRDPAAAIRQHAPAGVDRIVEVALSDNGELDATVVANDAVIATYFSRSDRIDLPFSPLLFANVTLRLLGSDDFSFQAKQQAAHDLTAAATAGALSVRAGTVFPLTQIAAAHDRVDGGGGGRVLVRIPDLGQAGGPHSHPGLRGRRWHYLLSSSAAHVGVVLRGLVHQRGAVLQPSVALASR